MRAPNAIALVMIGFSLGYNLVALVAAAPPAGADPAQAPFFKHLYSKQGLGSCCDVADCRPVSSRSPKNSPSGQWEVYIDKTTFGSTAPNDWIIVPADMVDDEPTTLPRPADAVACWSKYFITMSARTGHLRCFITPAVQD